MASNAQTSSDTRPGPNDARPTPLASRQLLLLVWLPIALITAVHYSAPPHHHWIHDVLRRIYYVPIVFAAFRSGVRGGLIAASVVTAAYIPHAYFDHLRMDPGGTLEKALEIVLYFVLGAGGGVLADQDRRLRRRLLSSLAEQHRLRHQLVRSERLSALGQVVAGIAHEIKNPLHSLLGTAEIVDPLIPTDAEERSMWEVHVEELHRLQRTSERFLSFARPQAGELQRLDLVDVARRLAELASAQARQRHVELKLRLPDDPVPVLGDRDLLAQVVLNIAVNGFQAMGEAGGRMRVVVQPPSSADDEMASLAVENDGPALDSDEIERLFDPFYTGQGDGSGLGLSISARIAEQHGGRIEAENAGLGVRFTLWLPVA